jgi:hypothetical protein
VGWDLDGRIGSIVIDGRERVGLVWVRDRARGRLVFEALPANPPTGDAPPQPERFEIDESEFKPIFSTSWARRRRSRNPDAD